MKDSVFLPGWLPEGELPTVRAAAHALDAAPACPRENIEAAAPQIALLVYLCDTDERSGALRLRGGTLAARAGDAVALDYRTEHGTHPNDADHRRDAVLLSFAPHWASLPEDVRGHLIGHLALPTADEDPSGRAVAPLLPRFDGPRADLPLNRTPPAGRVAA